MLTRLLAQSLLRLVQVALSGPGVCGAAGHLIVPEMPRGSPAVLDGKLELGRGLVVQLRRRFERYVQFQTLTSR